VNFGATDVPASSTDLAGARGGPAVQVPVDLGGISVAYNVMTLNGSLKLTGPVLARIFLGQITRWNDPAVTALNPGAALPNAYITVVHRADGNQGVASTILRIPDSIGYAEDSYTAGTAINSAAIANRDGNYVTPTPATITADAAAKPAITAQDFSIVDEPGPTPTRSAATAGSCSPPASPARPPGRLSSASSAGSPAPVSPTPPPSATSPPVRRPAARRHHTRPGVRTRQPAAHRLRAGVTSTADIRAMTSGLTR